MIGTKIERDMLRAVDALAGELADLTAQLVRTPTVNPYSGDASAGSEKAGQDLIAKHLRHAGAKVSRVPVPADIYRRCGVLGPEGRSWKGRENAVGRFHFEAKDAKRQAVAHPARSGRGRGKEQPRTLILNCHMDTVGVDSYEGDPFDPVVHAGRLYGRGSSDSKGNLAAGLIAIRALRKAATDISGEIVYESVVDEECNGVGAGTLACLDAGIVGDACLALDGGGVQPYIRGDGVVTPEITVTGQSGHAAFGAVNAIDKLLVVKAALDEFRRQRMLARRPRQMNIGVIRGGTHPAVVPAAASMQYNISYGLEEVDPAHANPPGWAIMQQFEQAVAKAADADDWLSAHPPAIRWIKDGPPYALPEDLRVVKIVSYAYESVCDELRPMDVLAWGDAAHFWNIAKIPAVGMGCGAAGTPHASVEYIDLADQLLNAKAIAIAAYRFLKG